MEDLANFARLVEAIRPWLTHVVIVGGWAHRLHRFHPLATAQEYQPLRTRDVDLAFSPGAPLDGDLREALSRAGFKEELSGEYTPPVAHYRLGEDDAGFYAEFLTAKTGSGLRRDGQPDMTVSKAGITAQKLRHLDLLLDSPWSVRIGPETNVPVERPVDLVVPNPVSFIVQKLLIHKRREPEKKPQDILYIHDALELFGGSLVQLRALWKDQMRARIPARTVKTAMDTATELFENVTDTIRDAARIPQDRRLLPEGVRATSLVKADRDLPHAPNRAEDFEYLHLPLRKLTRGNRSVTRTETKIMFPRKALSWLVPVLERYYEKRNSMVKTQHQEYLLVGQETARSNMPVTKQIVSDRVRTASLRVLGRAVHASDLRRTAADMFVQRSKRRGAILTKMGFSPLGATRFNYLERFPLQPQKTHSTKRQGLNPGAKQQ